MAHNRTLDDLSEEELRYLLIEKRRTARRGRMEHFQLTGRVIPSGNGLDVSHKKHANSSAEENPPRTKKNKTMMEKVLLWIEIGGAVGLVLALFAGYQVMRNLNQEVALSLTQPTLTPTALISAIVLPSGHTPPDTPGGVQPNDAEIPAHLLPYVQSMAKLPIPTSSPTQAVRIQIPIIKVDAPIVQGDNWEQLKKGVGQHMGSPNPGGTGNLVLSAHNDVFGEIFRDLDKLNTAEQVIVFTNMRSYTYRVKQIRIVDPTAVEVLAQTTDPILTLISCYPYMVNNKRIVVTAELTP